MNKCTTLPIVLYFILFLGPCVRSNFIHHYMNEPELIYYFQTNDVKSVPQYELVYIPVRETIGEEDTQSEELQYSFSAMKRSVSLKLRKNDLISPTFTTFIHDGEEIEQFTDIPNNCHYLHHDEFVAAVSICEPNSLHGLIFLDNTTLEIRPLNGRLQSLIKETEPILESMEYGYEMHVPHLVKRVSFESEHLMSDVFPVVDNLILEEITDHLETKDKRDFFHMQVESARGKPVGGLQLELALFFDEAAYKIFGPFLNYDMSKIQDLLLAYLNGVQALYHHPSLGDNLELTLVRMDIMKRQPSKMPHYNGERSKLLDSFCAYQESLNPRGDDNPKHWDMGLYVSGLDFYHIERGKKSGVTMGLATVGGVCLDKYACVIAELGTTNVFGKPYPSAGFTSVYILAHEIGHNLGMHHDSTGNSCSKEGYIMSPSRGTNGETTWSRCSAEVMAKLSWATCLTDWGEIRKDYDHTKFSDVPGLTYTAKTQCEILLRDKDAVMSPSQKLSTICYNLQCKTPHRSGYYFAGPALDGTQCGNQMYCYGGECVNKKPPKPIKQTPGGWSSWIDGKCSSGCIEKSMGSQMKRRYCNNPTPVNSDEGCEGASVDFGLCKDHNICSTKKSIIEFASDKCREFSKLLPELDKKGKGLQAPHEEDRVWMSCAIFCKRGDSKSYYTPRIELNDLGVSPYFPDGTWCHRANNVNYYCLHHHCLPENFKFTKTYLHDLGEDIPISQNAHPHDVMDPAIKSYLSLMPDGQPMQKTLNPNDVKQPSDELWETQDYVEVPELKERYKL